MQVFGMGNTAKIPKHHPYLAFDIEDNSKGEFLIGVIYGEKRSKKKVRGEKNKLRHFEKIYLGMKGFAEMCAFINDLSPYEAHLIGFNTGYDLGILDPLIGDKIDYSFAKGRFIQAKTAKRKAIIRDLSNHFPQATSLEDLMETIDMKKDHPTDAEDKERRAGKINQAWIDRCYNDAKATWMLTKMLEDFYTENGTAFKATIGSSGLELYKRRFFKSFKHFWMRDEKRQWLNEYEHKAYYGGRTEGFKHGELEVWSYDINSAYVSAMRNNVYPDPNSARWHGVKESTVSNLKKYMKKYRGVAKVRIKVPKMKYQPLPYKDAEGKLLFPAGMLVGYWAFAEIKLALRMGCVIKKVFTFVHYKHSHAYFKEFAEWVWSERKKHPKETDPFVNLMIKLLGNSLYGKWGQRNEVAGIYVRKENYDKWLRDLPKSKEGKELLKKLRNDELAETDLGTHWFISVAVGAKTEYAKHAFPILSACITSDVRIYLYEEMIKHDTVYVDTDSVKYVGEKEEIEDSAELGGFGYEEDKSGIFEFFAPKFYKFNHNLKIKGIPKKVLSGERGSYVETDKCVTATYDKPNKWRESKRRKLVPSKWKEIIKTAQKEDTKRVWLDNGDSEPIVVNC